MELVENPFVSFKQEISKVGRRKKHARLKGVVVGSPKKIKPQLVDPFGHNHHPVKVDIQQSLYQSAVVV